MMIPFSLQYLNSSSWIKDGWASIWFIAGTTPVAEMTFSSWSTVKLETPIARTFLVSFEIRTSSAQVSVMLGQSVSISRSPLEVLGKRSEPGVKGTGQ